MPRPEELFARIESLGVAAIDQFMAERAQEELFLDFKGSAQRGAGGTLNADDAKNLSKAISGFGNAEGGLLLWGIDCREDRTSGEQIVTKAPLENARAFQSKIENAVSRLSIPHHSLVRNTPVLEPDGTSGYVATLIPKAEFAPIRAIAPGLQRYYLRAGSSFADVPHDALAGFFGRRPQPTLWPQFTSHPVSQQLGGVPFATLGIGIFNNGPNLAQRPYVSIHPLSANAQRNLFVQTHSVARFDVSVSAFRNAQVVSKADLVIAPGGMEDVCTVMLSLRDVASIVEFEVTVGAQNSGPTKFRLDAPVERLSAARDSIVARTVYDVFTLYDLGDLIARFNQS